VGLGRKQDDRPHPQEGEGSAVSLFNSGKKTPDASPRKKHIGNIAEFEQRAR